MNEGLKHCGVPLGGIGTGSVELRQDGYFHEWQIMNNKPWGSGPLAEFDTNARFFGLQVSGKNISRSAVLGLVPSRARTFSFGGDYLNDPYTIPELEHADEIDIETQVPFTRLKYHLLSLPVDIKMEAFSPFIPLDTKNSSLPVAFFTFSLKNRSNKDLKISLFNAQRNLTGYSKQDKLSEITFKRKANADIIKFKRKNLPEKSPDNGTMVIGAFSDQKAKTSYVLHTRSPRDIWDPLRKSGVLENIDIAETKKNMSKGLPLGVLCQTIKLKPGKTAKITFVLAWHFPNHWEEDNEEKNIKGSCIGHKYSQWFNDAEDVYSYGFKNFKKLKQESAKFITTFYQSSFPQWFLDEMAAHFTTLIKSSWWDRKGRFGIWEGLGVCGLQTMDITFYGSFPIIQFFPELQKSQMFLTVDNIEISGKIPHNFPGTFACSDADHRNRIDLNPEFILLIWRDVVWTGDINYLRRMWPVIKDALEWYKSVSRNGDLLPHNKGKDTSYDQFPFMGTSAYVGFLHAASLFAAAQLAAIMKEPETELKLNEDFSTVSIKLQEQLWTGNYFRLCFDSTTGVKNEGIMTDQILADWFIRQTTGQGILPDRQVKAVLNTILKECSTDYGGVLNCSWPKGDSIEINRGVPDQARTPWTGVEFSFAAHLALMGMERPAVKIVKDIWERYEKKGLRFIHIECGDHYYRALSAWAVYLALTGFSMNAIEKSVTFKINKKAMTFLISTPAAWGSVKTQSQTKIAEISIQRGTMVIKRINLKNIKTDNLKVFVNNKILPCWVEKTNQGRSVVFKNVLNLLPGKIMNILQK